MRTIQFQSGLAIAMVRFVSLRRLSGTDYFTQALNLRYFDDFLVKEEVAIECVSQAIFTRYLQTLSHLAQRTRGNRISVVRQFCIHLSQTKPYCYIPEPVQMKKPSEVRTPYIFSRAQIFRLLEQASKLSPQESLRPHTFHALFGVLYSTGIRIGEARNLNIGDIHLRQQRLYVKQGKFRKARWVPLSTSSNSMLENYLSKRQRFFSTSKDAPLFVSLKRNRLSHPTASKAFSILLKQCEIQSNPKPRIHDLRHTFAVQRLLQWYEDGLDINSRLPALATYMGHVNIYSTQVYLHSTPELLKVVELEQ